jgi:hypothetical protein
MSKDLSLSDAFAAIWQQSVTQKMEIQVLDPPKMLA